MGVGGRTVRQKGTRIDDLGGSQPIQIAQETKIRRFHQRTIITYQLDNLEQESKPL